MEYPIKRSIHVVRYARVFCALVILLCFSGAALAQEGSTAYIRHNEVPHGSIFVDGQAYTASAAGDGWTLTAEDGGFTIALESYVGGSIQSGSGLAVTVNGTCAISAEADYALGATGVLTIAGDGTLDCMVTAPADNSWIKDIWSAEAISIDSRVNVSVIGGAYANGIELDDRQSHTDTAASLLLTDNAQVAIHAETTGHSGANISMAAGIAMADTGTNLLTVEKGATLSVAAVATQGDEEAMAMGIDARSSQLYFAGSVDIAATAKDTAYGIVGFDGGLLTAPGSRLSINAQAAYGTGLMLMDDAYIYGDADMQGSTQAVSYATPVYREDNTLVNSMDDGDDTDAMHLVIQGSTGAVLFVAVLAAVSALFLLLPDKRCLQLVSCALAAVLVFGGVLTTGRAIAEAAESEEIATESAEAAIDEEGTLVAYLPDTGIDLDAIHSIWDEDLEALYASFEGDDSTGIVGAGIISYLGDMILNSIIDAVINWTVNDIFDNIFPKDDPNQLNREILKQLDGINNRLKNIERDIAEIKTMLEKLQSSVNDIKIQQQAQKIQLVLTNHYDRLIPLLTAIETTRGNVNGVYWSSTKRNYLKSFFKTPPTGNRDTLEYIQNTVMMMQGGTARPDVFSSYDQFAYLAGGWQSSSEDFRETMRTLDVVILFEGLALCSLYQRVQLSSWIQDRDCPVTKYDVERLRKTAKQLMDYCEKKTITHYPVGYNRFVVPYVVDAVTFGFGDTINIDTTNFDLTPGTWKGMLVDESGTARPFSDKEYAAMLRQLNLHPDNANTMEKLLEMGGYYAGILAEYAWVLCADKMVTYRYEEGLEPDPDEYNIVTKSKYFRSDRLTGETPQDRDPRTLTTLAKYFSFDGKTIIRNDKYSVKLYLPQRMYTLLNTQPANYVTLDIAPPPPIRYRLRGRLPPCRRVT